MAKFLKIALLATMIASGLALASARADTIATTAGCDKGTYAPGGTHGAISDAKGRTCVDNTLSSTIGKTTSVLTRPANTTGYTGTGSAPQLVGSSTTAGSVVVPSFTIGASGGSAAAPVGVLTTNATTGWGSVSLVVTVWNAAPTFTNGDGGAYVVATGASNFAAQYSCTLIQFGDGASCNLVPVSGALGMFQPVAGAAMFWDLQIQSSAAPISGQTFSLKLPSWN